MDPSRFITRSLKSSPRGDSIKRILAAALGAVEPAAAVRRNLHRQEDQLVIAGRAYHLDRYHRVFIVGAGKAAYPMASQAARQLSVVPPVPGSAGRHPPCAHLDRASP